MKCILAALFGSCGIILSLAAAPLPPGAALVEHIGGLTANIPSGPPATLPLWSRDAPGVHTKWYAVVGQVRYDGVVGTGYFNLWNVFGVNGATTTRNSYFTRTLAQSGPMAKLAGSSDWRPLILPFDGSKASGPPTRLELDLVVGGKGTVEVRDLDLVEFADAGAMWGALGVGWLGGGFAAIWVKAAGVGAVAALGVIVAVGLWRRRRREVRRMRAMDAG